jgi:hypothetical protein
VPAASKSSGLHVISLATAPCFHGSCHHVESAKSSYVLSSATIQVLSAYSAVTERQDEEKQVSWDLI